MSRSLVPLLTLVLAIFLLPPLKACQAIQEPPDGARPQLRLHCDKTQLLTAEVAFLLLEIHNPTDREMFLPQPDWENWYNDWSVLNLDINGRRLSITDSGCGSWVDPGFAQVLHPGQRRFRNLKLGPYADYFPEEGRVSVEVSMTWARGDAAQDYERVFGPEQNFEVAPRSFQPESASVKSNSIELEYFQPTAIADMAVLNELKQRKNSSGRKTTIGDWSADTSDFWMKSGVDDSSVSHVYRLSGAWFHLPRFDYEERWRQRYGLDPEFPSLAPLREMVTALKLQHVEDDFLYGVARAIYKRKPEASIRIMRHVAAQFPARDHGIRAKAFLDDVKQSRYISTY